MGCEYVHRLLTTWAQLLPGAWLLFDAVTPNIQALRQRSPLPSGYRPPEWTWIVDADELRRLDDLAGVSGLHKVPQARGDRMLAILTRIPGLKNQLPVIPAFQARLGLNAA